MIQSGRRSSDLRTFPPISSQTNNLQSPLLSDEQDDDESAISSTCCSFQCCSIPKNHNVRYILLYSFFWYLAASIFQRDLLSVLVKKISGSSQDVGFISGAQGLTQVVLAIPVGYYGDRFLRQSLLRSGVVVGCIALAITSYVFINLKPNSSLLLFYIGFGVWGAFVVLTNPALESLFADSVATGDRAHIFSIKYATLQIASATGPFVSVLLFYKLGDTWDLNVLRIVLLIGSGIGVFAILFLLLLKDSAGLGSESEVIEDTDDNAENMESEQWIDNINHNQDELHGNTPRCCSCLCGDDTNRTIRWTIAICDVATSTAAGMTVKFFPLFFVSEGKGEKLGYKFTPIELSWVYLVMPICTVTVAVVLPRLIKRKIVSRPAAMLLCKAAGIAALYGMVFFDLTCSNPIAMASLFIFRTAIMNGSAGIKRSILMDAVPKAQRVRWNSLESITRLTWSGSAALGGVLIDALGYRQTFLITAIVYTISTTPLLLLLPIVD